VRAEGRRGRQPSFALPLQRDPYHHRVQKGAEGAAYLPVSKTAAVVAPEMNEYRLAKVIPFVCRYARVPQGCVDSSPKTGDKLLTREAIPCENASDQSSV
jgi:hypothetical protein